jgi:hypothetical protein
VKEYLMPLAKYINFVWLLIIIHFCITVIVVNFRYLDKLNNTIDTMWHEIEQVKDTNIKLYQFIEEHGNDITGR